MYELILTSNARRDLRRLDAKIQNKFSENLDGSVKIVTNPHNSTERDNIEDSLSYLQETNEQSTPTIIKL